MQQNSNIIFSMKLKAYRDKLERDKTQLISQVINLFHNEKWIEMTEIGIKLSQIDFALKTMRECFKEEFDYKFEMEE